MGLILVSLLILVNYFCFLVHFKTRKNHKLVLVTEQIFCNNLKANERNPVGFLSMEPGWC